MYVSNEERMRLGIQRYGSDVPVAEYEKAKAAKDGTIAKRTIVWKKVRMKMLLQVVLESSLAVMVGGCWQSLSVSELAGGLCS